MILVWIVAVLWLAALVSAQPALSAPADSAAALQARYAALAGKLQHTAFQRPLVLESSETDRALTGDIYARVDYPFATVSRALNNPQHWCDVMILHLNTKFCRADSQADHTRLAVRIGKKTPQSLTDAHLIEFNYRAAEVTPRYLAIKLDAPSGPLGTRDYRIQLQAIPVGSGQTFLHLTYTYGYGTAGRLAMKSYLATLGRDKVGFTRIGQQSNGQPDFIDGMRGVAERNTMRYYLAIDAYLGALSAPPARQLQTRLLGWFNATEQYPRQLHEIERDAYLDMKRNEYRRQNRMISNSRAAPL